MSFLRNFSLSKKLLLVVMIPAVSFLISSGLKVFENYKGLGETESMKAANEANILVSNLIRDLQVERGKSAVYLKSKGSLDISMLGDQRAKVDGHRAKIEVYFQNFPAVLATFPEFGQKIGEIDQWRKRVESNAPVSEVVPGYTTVVRSAMNFIKASSDHASAVVSSKIRGQYMLEAARESSGLLRAKMSGMLAADTPISEGQFQGILALKASMDNNIQSKVLDIDESSKETIATLASREHWNTVDYVFKIILTKSGEGGFGQNAVEFFGIITKVVDDIGGLINAQLAHVDQTIGKERQVALNNLYYSSAAIAVNLLLIFLFSFLVIRDINAGFNKVIGNVTTSTGEISDASSNLSTSSQRLAAGSQETAAALHETVSSLAEMKSMVSKTVDKSKETKDSAEHVGAKVDLGNGSVDQMIRSMESIKESNQQLEEINKVISSIAKQTQVINDIVFKTQLLAVNASIESAKAGVHGKGFAVVADEVSKLALMSGEASTKISSLLEESDDKVNSIIKEVSQRVDRGMETSHRVSEVFKDITSQMTGIQSHSEDMKHASEEQSLGIEQVSAAVSQIDDATQSNTAEAHLLEKFATKLQDQISDLNVVATRLHQFVTGKRSASAVPPGVDLSEENNNVTHLNPLQDMEVADEDILADDDSFRPAG